jgi:acyl carrier protein
MSLLEVESHEPSVCPFGDFNVLSTSTDDVLRRISSIVAEIAQRHDVKEQIAAHDTLVDRGMTSMAMVDLMLAIEADLDVMIPQREMTPSNFESIASLAAMIRRVRGGA